MTKQELRIIFLGTPEFAVSSLHALVNNGFNVVAVVTAADKPAGRGMQLQQSAVKKYAAENNIPVLQPEKLKNEDFLQQLKSYNAHIQIVVAFRMLPQIVWDMPPLGTINVHGSLLPQYRGAAPINWAIINGEKKTGVTTFKLKHEIDTGNLLLQKEIEIRDNESAGELHDEMKEAGAQLLVETIHQLIDGSLQEQPQDIKQFDSVKHASKIFTETCAINFTNPVKEIYNLVRGLSPYPSAFCFLNNKKLKIFSCNYKEAEAINEIGAPETDGKTYLRFTAANGYIDCLDVQLEGKKRMLIQDFLRGYRL